MTEPLSPTVKAGRLIRLLGWVNLILAVTIGTAIVLPNIVKNEPIQLSIWALIAAAIFVSLAILVIGAGVKNNKAWAKVLGTIVCVISLANVPIGTVVGAIAIFYLAKGWSNG